MTVGVIGGSITQGASATTPERRYGDLVAAWWRQRFPKAEIRFVNAGIGATGSNYGALRVRRDLLDRQPDFIVVEYAVNDPNTRESAESLEGLLRQVLRAPGQPAVVLLFTMHRDGGNAQEWQSKVGRHYRLPMLSFRDALWPEIQTGRMKWEDVEADAVHPNDRGHAYVARLIRDYLSNVLRSPSAESRPASVAERLPPPLISDLFEHVALYESDTLKPVSNEGWTYNPQNHRWQTDKPGSIIEFEVDGSVVLAMHWVIRGPMGRARVTVDGGAPKELEGWFDQTWGGYHQANEIARGLTPGKHRIRFEALAEKHPQSTGFEFGIFGLGTAGS
ncbi:MAG TPA: SGNH/GDSL hydrolase family protein [Phycisphaerae bacterium]|nr:SGNH/GDSL hydrolase family protein [Phycisphaerae bacterium]HRY71291.1 SGNH/GDSL hydrolase family protein [Phycisphaerae bacterium]